MAHLQEKKSTSPRMASDYNLPLVFFYYDFDSQQFDMIWLWSFVFIKLVTVEQYIAFSLPFSNWLGARMNARDR